MQLLIRALLAALLCGVGAACAEDYKAGTGNADLDAWLAALNDKAKTNPAGPVAEISGASGGTTPIVEGYLKKGIEPADAYMIVRLTKICACGARRVLSEYEQHRSAGWGEIAQNVEVSPRSLDFMQLRVRVDTLRAEDTTTTTTPATSAPEERAVDSAVRTPMKQKRKEKRSDRDDG